ncbi:YheC/YheD family endospore coat-associated protein [Paenibacillus cymbidii]|uniref:YheC/YheD family endospore coat-associated protein n=1 Tax=Paenibacillus cymbidii TaxID=1639034 RepID=UPI0010800CFA|nr:YheC/YheD family protein [Paenibacillus cymbidii]
MSSTICTVAVSQQEGRAVTMTRALSKALQLSGGRTILLRIGSKSVNVPLKLVNRAGLICTMSAPVAASLRLPWRGKCMIRNVGNRELQIGPLIGILTNTLPGSANPFGSRSGFVREFMHTCHGKAFYIGFSPGQVDWEEEVVVGYVPGEGGRWVRKTTPLPDVVYNRLTSRTAEKSMSMDQFKNRFVRRKIPFFNWSFFDKWDVYRLLQGEEINRHVPDSINSPKTEDIQRMLEKHRFVYLKPTAGSLGIGIYRLTYNPGRGYFARFHRGGTNMLLRFPRFEGLVSLLQRHNVRLVNYVVQQGIRLIEIDNCPIDFRFHMMKNGNNQWVPVGIGAKKAGRGSVTTHVRTGGQLMTPEYVLGRAFGGKADQLLQNAKDVSVKLAEAIEKNYPHSLVELGFDLGIDQNERVWMFEANAKPGRSIFKHPSLKAQGKATFTHLLDHILYVSRFRARRDS